MISTFIKKHNLDNIFANNARDYFVPLADDIKTRQAIANNTFFIGLNGCQGSGKSTLSEFLKEYLSKTYSLGVVVMSLDDFYISKDDRRLIADQFHPLFNTRGVPATHNMAVLKAVLLALKHQQSTTIPSFNKVTDEPSPISAWTEVVSAVDVVIVEGWCWGVTSQTPAQLAQAVNSLEALEDPQAKWRTHVNLELSLNYQPLYHLMDCWVMLKAPSFDNVLPWRLEQEQQLAAATKNTQPTKLMDQRQIQRFIQHFQRLTEQALETMANSCDHVFELSSSRAISAHRVKNSST
ncbi:kinase [uncultured Paraglaciecola sp.]|uniref:kinase n=1 Tax=uncultured Paraglaciecola sp. TaxID=1765024 RepID=UPI0026035649|nr:kinase [uncultured Paraglaciecola sp.]